MILSLVYDSPAADPLLRAVLRSTARVGDAGLPRAGYGPAVPERDTVSIRFLVERIREISGDDQAVRAHVNLIAGLSPDGMRSLNGVFAMMYVMPGPSRGVPPALADVMTENVASEVFDIAADHILCSVMKSKRLLPGFLEADEGWVEEDDGDIGATYYRLSGETLEIVVHTDNVSDPYPPAEVDVIGVKNLVLFGDAYTDDLDEWLPDLLIRTPNLETFAAVDVCSDNDSFNCVADADLPMLRTLMVDVLITDEKSDVTDPLATANELSGALRQQANRQQTVLLMVRHDVESSDYDYERCSGLMMIC